MRFFGSRDKQVLIQCPYANEGTKDFCNPKKPYTLNMSSPDFNTLMENHVQQHVERDSALFGLAIKRLSCPICSWETKPFPSNNASKLKALGREEMEAMIDMDDHITGNDERVAKLKAVLSEIEQLSKSAKDEQDLAERSRKLQRLSELEGMDEIKQHIQDYSGHLSCELHETPGHEILVYYFRDKDEKDLHVKLLHQPKVKPINPKLRKQ